MSNIVKVIGLGAACVIGVGYAMSKSVDQGNLEFNPGLWESTTTISSDLTGTQTNTQTECMTHDSFDPEQLTEEMLSDMPSDECSTETDISGTNLTFAMSCEANGGSIEASGEWSFSGDEGTGSMDMNMDIQGMKMTVEMEFDAERIGDC